MLASSRRTVVLFVLLALVTMSQRAHAQTATSTSSSVSMPRWQGGVVIDAEMRAMLRAPTEEGRKVADDASSVLLYTMVAAPFIAGAARTMAAHGSLGDMAGLSLVSAEAFGVAFAATYAAKVLVARERPYATGDGLATYCVSHATDPMCGSDRNASFFSGHSAIAFTGAGLLCTQQIFFGPRGVDALGCAGGMLAATATAMLRIVADMHYASDTMIGAAIGLTSGMLLPYVLHFAPWAPFKIAKHMRNVDAEQGKKNNPLVGFSVAPFGAQGGGGLAISAQFR